MIAHVAEAGEGRGRVVLRVCNESNPLAFAAAVRIARAYHAEIESLYVEDENLLTLARFPFAKELSPEGRHARRFSEHDIQREFRILRRRAATMLQRLAEPVEVVIHQRVIRDDPVRALAVTCAANGPWNVVVLSEPISRGDYAKLSAVLEAVPDATAIALVGPKTQQSYGPVLAVVDRMEQLHGSLRTAQRLAEAGGQRVVLLLVGETDAARLELESAARLVLGAAHDLSEDIAIASAGPTAGAPSAMAGALVKINPSFVIARIGGPLVSDDEGIAALRTGLMCPLLLVRS